MAAHVSEIWLVTLDTTAMLPTRLQICQAEDARESSAFGCGICSRTKLTYQDEIVPRLGCTALFAIERVDASFE
jgi:hypothetical protein